MRVIIVGAGIAGLTLALALRERGHEPIVLERSPRLRDEGYMIDFFGPGYDAAERLGLISELERIHYPIARLAYLDEDGREGFSLTYPALRHRLFDDRHFNFMRGALERVLHDRVAGTVDIRFGTTISSYDGERVRVRAFLSDGTVLEGDALVGADGIHSRVRSLAFGPEERFWRPLGYRSAAYVLDHRLPVLAEDTFATLTVPGRQVAVYPVRGGRTATFFAHRVPPDWSAAQSPREELAAIYGRLGWVVPALLEAIPDPPALYLDDVAQVELPSWSAGRVVLIGDACQAVSLLAGQGASMAMAGALALSEELDATTDVREAAERYEHRVRPPIERKQAAGRNIAAWFLPEDRLHLAIRDLALRVSVWPVLSAVVRNRLDATDLPPRTG